MFKIHACHGMDHRFLLIAEEFFIVWVFHSLCIHLSVEGWVVSHLTITLKAAANILHRVFCDPVLFLVLVTKLCPTLCDPMDCTPPGSSLHGIFQSRKLGLVSISFSRDLPDPGTFPTQGPSRPRDRIHTSCTCCTGKWILYRWATWDSRLADRLMEAQRSFRVGP